MIRYLIICLALCFSVTASAETTRVRLVTSEFAPLQYGNNNPKGYVVDLLDKLRPILLKKHNIELGNIEFFPWRRAIQIASNDKNTLFFSLSRTPQRENKFIWMAEVSPYRQAIFSLEKTGKNQSETPFNNWQELVHSHRILAIQSGSQLQNYVSTDLAMLDEQLYPVPHYLIAIKMLFAGRIDFLPLTEFLAKGTLCRSGYPSERLKYNFTINEFANPLWAAFSLNTDKKVINSTRHEMLKISQSNWYVTHQNDVIERWNQEQCRNLARAN
jgi:polar amino acid transport system substrate-binding protein